MSPPALKGHSGGHSLKNSLSAFCPALFAKEAVSKKPSDCTIGLERPARYISQRQGCGSRPRSFTTTEKSVQFEVGSKPFLCAQLAAKASDNL